MSDLIITKFDEVYAKIDCEKSTAKELHEYRIELRKKVILKS